MLTPHVQPYAGLLPPRVLEPGKAVGTITDQMAELTGLPKACTVCAGTSGLQRSLCLLLPYMQQLCLPGWMLLLGSCLQSLAFKFSTADLAFQL